MLLVLPAVSGSTFAARSVGIISLATCRQCVRHDVHIRRKMLHSSRSLDQQLQEVHKADASSLPDGHGINIEVSKFAKYLAEKKKGENIVSLTALEAKSEEESKTALKKRLKEERKILKLEGRRRRIRDGKRAASIAQKRVLRRKTVSNMESSDVTGQQDVKTWKQKMSNALGEQDDDTKSKETTTSHRKDPEQESDRRDSRRRGAPGHYKRQRAATLAETVAQSRLKQPQTSSGDQARRSAPTPTRPGDYGRKARLNFDETEIFYPPSDVYPPPVPLISESNPIAAGRALGILKSCDVEWDTKARPPRWIKSFRVNEYYEEKDLPEYLDNEQALEYLGDSALHLLSRSLIMDRFPGKTVFAYNMASSWLISNGCFAYMYEDCGLAEERIRVAKVLMEISKKREIQEWSATLTDEQRKQQEDTPLGEPVLPAVLHLRKADFFEAYVGAVYLTLGFATVSKWIVPLFEPWLDAIGRTAAFHQVSFLSASGDVERRAAIQAELKAAEERRKSQTWWGRMKDKFFRLEKPAM